MRQIRLSDLNELMILQRLETTPPQNGNDEQRVYHNVAHIPCKMRQTRAAQIRYGEAQDIVVPNYRAEAVINDALVKDAPVLYRDIALQIHAIEKFPMTGMMVVELVLRRAS